MLLTRRQLLWRRYTLPPSRLVSKIGVTTQVVLAIARKPRLTGLWLTSARRTQFALSIVVLLMVFVVPASASAVADAVFRPVTEEKRVLFLLKRDRTFEHPWRDQAYRTMLTGSWVLGLSLAGLLLMQHAPAAVRLGQRRGRASLAMARQVSDPMESARLTTVANGLVTDASALDGVLDRDMPAEAANAPKKTVLLSEAESGTRKFIGADNRYRLEKVIGSGGMGVVRAGFDTLLNRRVACKQLSAHLVSDPEQSQRFRQEATALAALNHNHIVGVYDLLEESRSFWIVMELCTGGSLGEQIRDGLPLQIEYCVDVVSKIASGLAYAHSQGMVHRDVKPMNILFTENGTPKLADFGNAKVAMPTVHTQYGVTLASPIYMSPEQAEGKQADYRSDIYSLGVTLYHALTGSVPFDGDLAAILAQHIGQDPVPPVQVNPDVSQNLSDAVLVMLSKKPEDRFRDMDQVIAALHESSAVA
jgi:serine/threonine-protein kinase